jgi:hypothetical protein
MVLAMEQNNILDDTEAVEEQQANGDEGGDSILDAKFCEEVERAASIEVQSRKLRSDGKVDVAGVVCDEGQQQ